MQAECPHCQSRLDVSNFTPAQELACPHCNNLFTVPLLENDPEDSSSMVFPRKQKRKRATRRVSRTTKKKYPNLVKFVAIMKMNILVFALIAATLTIGVTIFILTKIDFTGDSFDSFLFAALTVLGCMLVLAGIHWVYISRMAYIELMTVWMDTEANTRN